MKKLLLLLLTVFPLYATATDWQALDQELAQFIGESDIGGCVVGAYENANIVFARGYGMAVTEHQIPLGPNIKMDIGSISKQFTVLAALIAEQHGFFSMQDKVHTHLPELPDYGAPVTLDMLAFHTSGIYPHFYVSDFLEQVEVGVISELKRLQQVSRFNTLNFPPGEGWMYNNTGFLMLNLIIERSTGLTLREFSEKYIFEPLGMNNTHFYDNYAEVIPNMAAGYEAADGGGYRRAPRIEDTVGAGGLLSTLNDFARYQGFFTNPTLGKNPQELLQKFLRVGTDGEGEPLSNGYGYGIWHGQHRGSHTISHGGTTDGFHSYFRRFMDDDFAVLVSCNRGDIPRDQVFNKVVDARYGKQDLAQPSHAFARLMGKIGDQISGSYLNPEGLFVSVDVSVDAGILQAITPLGIYRFANASEFSGNSIRFVSTDLTADSAGYEMDTITLQRGADKTDWEFEYRSDLVPGAVLSRQTPKQGYSTPDLDLTGTYIHRDSGVCQRIYLEDSALLLDPGNKGKPLPLTRKTPELYIFSGSDFIHIRQNQRGKVRAYTFNRLLFRGVTFERTKHCGGNYR